MRLVTFVRGFQGSARHNGPAMSAEQTLEADSHLDWLAVTDSKAGAKSSDPRVKSLVSFISSCAQGKRHHPDLYYFTSLHDPTLTLLPAILIKWRLLPPAPVLIAPNGECAPAALEISRWKKSLLQRQARRVFPRDLTFHATSPHERREIQDWSQQAQPNVIEAPHPAPPPQELASHGSGEKRLRISYLSRIHPNKGLLDAIKALAQAEVECFFDVYGVIDSPDYWAQCVRALNTLPNQVVWQAKGAYDPTEVFDIVSLSDLVLMPTRGESFGRAIAECMSVGCPMVLSSKTLWTSTAQQGGWVADSPKEMAAAITSASTEDDGQRYQRRSLVLESYRKWYLANNDNFSPFPAWRSSRVIHRDRPNPPT